MSKELEALEKLLEGYSKGIAGRSYYDTIQQALIKAQEQEKVLEIIKEKGIDMVELGCAEYYYQYNKEVYEKYHAADMLLRQEEFELLKRVLDNE